MPVSDTRFDFLAANAATHAILGTGETITPTGLLPRYAGAHLVGGSAMFGEWELVGTLPDRHFPTRHLSANGRWLGVEIDDVLNVYDLEGGVRRGFSFPLPRHSALAILPDGDMVAVRTADEVRLLLPDGEEIGRAVVPGIEGPEELRASACGGFVRLFQSPQEGEHVLTILKVPDLASVSRRPVRYRNERSEVVAACENCSVYPDSGGDRLLVVEEHWNHFALYLLASYAVGERRIDLPTTVNDFAGTPVFAPVGDIVLMGQGQARLSEWFVGGANHPRSPHGGLWLKEYEPYFEAFAYTGDLVVVLAECSIRLLLSGTLEPVGLPTFHVVDALLPNGMTLTRSWRGVTEIRRLRRDGVREGVVIEIDSDDGECTRVWAREGDGWRDVTAGVVWAMPAFDVARYA